MCWAPFIGQRLDCKPYSRTESLTYDKYALGVYKHVEDKEELVGHLPIELSQLLNNFLSTDGNTNNLTAEVIGKRKREIGFVVPAKYRATTNDKKFAEILERELLEKKEFIEIEIVENELKRFPCYD